MRDRRRGAATAASAGAFKRLAGDGSARLRGAFSAGASAV